MSASNFLRVVVRRTAARKSNSDLQLWRFRYEVVREDTIAHYEGRVVLSPGETRKFAWEVPGGATVVGVFVDHESRALVDAEIVLIPWNDGTPGSQHVLDLFVRDAQERSVRTDSQGQFSFVGVAPGFWLAGVRSVDQFSDVLVDEPRCPVGTLLQIEPGNRRLDVNLRSPRPYYISGRVVNDRVAADSRTSRGAFAVYAKGDGIGGAFSTLGHGHEGNFRVGPLPEGTYQLWTQLTEGQPVVALAGDTGVELIVPKEHTLASNGRRRQLRGAV